MKLSCPTCQARYTIADEKVLGKVVKIRCKRCRSIIVVEGAIPEEQTDPGTEAPEPRTVEASNPWMGQRHEQSVLFSLASLQQGRPADPTAAAPSESSGLIDLQMLARAMKSPDRGAEPGDDVLHLGVGGIFAPQALGVGSESASEGTSAPADHPHARAGSVARGVIAALGVALVALVASAATFAASRAPSTREIPATTATSELAPPLATNLATAVGRTDASSDLTLAQATPPSVPALRSQAPAPIKPARTARATPIPSTTASAHPVPSASPSRCCPGETEMTCEMRRAVGTGCINHPLEPAAARALGP